MNMPIEGSTGTSGWSKHSSPALADLDKDGRLEIVIGSLDGRLYVYNDDGSSLWNAYLDAPGTAAGSIQSSPAVGDIDHDGSLDVVVGSDNGWVFAFNAAGAIKPGWPQFTGWNADYPARCATNACTGVIAPPTLADLDGDGTLEVVVGSYSHKMFVWNYKGDVLPGWPVDVWDGIASGAAVGDINADGRPEIVVGSDVENNCADCKPYGALAKGGLIHAFTPTGHELAGWPFRTDSFMHSTPALADLDGDGRLEVLAGGGLFPTEAGTRGHHLWVVGADGSLRWSFATRGNLIAAPAVGDVDRDGLPEIALSDYSGVTYLLDRSGNLRWSNQGVTTSAPNGSGAHFGAPVLADVTGDGRAEVVATDSNWHVKAFDVPTGATVADSGTTFPIWGSAAVGDLDGDGTNEVVAGSAVLKSMPAGTPLADLAGAGKVYVWRTAGRGGLVAPQFQSRVVPTDRSLAPADLPGATTRVYRFWSPGFDNAHFFTTSAAEAWNLIDTDRNWFYEGPAFSALNVVGGACTRGSAVYRFYSPVFRSHFYTIDAAEKGRIASTDPNWTYEGVAYCAYPSAQAGTTALYRFWSARFGKHFFTSNKAESDQLRTNDPNWAYEGVAFYVLP